MDDIGVERSIGIADKCIEIGSGKFCLKADAAEVCSVNDVAEKVVDMKEEETLSFLEQEMSKEMNIENLSEVLFEEFFPSDEGLELGSLVDFVQETTDIRVVEKCVENCGQVVVENIDSTDGVSKEVAFSVEEELSRVSLNPELNCSDMAGAGGSKMSSGVVSDEASVAKIDILDNGVKESAEILNGDGGGKEEAVSNKVENESESETESESESESESSGSSSSSSDTSSDESDDDKDEAEDEGEHKRKTDITGVETEMEEGEIILSEANDMVAWSDDEDEDDAGGNAVKGPIRSKNEIADLPPVPAVNVSLLAHHHTLPVGVILSIMGSQVVVEGVEKHDPLNEGSILWITESRSPLGAVDEIFGPVKNPYYIVRYNSESEVPAGVQQGTQISFVPEFADHVLNNANLYRKGYDASGEYDEELSDEAEFSDDEKEAEYRRMQKMKKRGTNDKGEDRKKDKRKSKNQFGVGKHEQSAAKQTHDFGKHQQSTAKQTHDFGKHEQSAAMQTHDFANNASTQNSVQPPGGGFPTNPQMQGIPWLQGNHPQPVMQAPFQNMAPFQQNMHMNPSLPFASFPGGVSPNFLNQALFGMGMQGNTPTLTNFGPNAGSFSGFQHNGVAQNFLNQSLLGMAMQYQNASTLTNVGTNAVSSTGFQQMGTSNPGQDGSQNFNPGNPGQDGFQNFNPGNPGQNGLQNSNPGNPGQDSFQNSNPGTQRGGRRPYRGGGRFGGGRGRRRS